MIEVRRSRMDVRHSRCREDFLKRVKENAGKRRSAKTNGSMTPLPWIGWETNVICSDCSFEETSCHAAWVSSCQACCQWHWHTPSYSLWYSDLEGKSDGIQESISWFEWHVRVVELEIEKHSPSRSTWSQSWTKLVLNLNSWDASDWCILAGQRMCHWHVQISFWNKYGFVVYICVALSLGLKSRSILPTNFLLDFLAPIRGILFSGFSTILPH